jgi:hypothetical protein
MVVGFTTTHHLYVIFSVKPLYSGKFILKIIPEVISEDLYFSQMYQNPEVLQNILIKLDLQLPRNAMSAYHHLHCEFEPHSWQSVLDTLYDKLLQ